MAHDIEGLKQHVSTLDAAISKLHTAKHAERLITIIHRPGWTTPREFELVKAHVEALSGHVSSLDKSLGELVAIADKIGN
jgi:hypothetical protein